MSDHDTILPPNRTPLMVGVENGLKLTTPDVSPVGHLMNPDTCPVHLLGWLAWAFSVDVWDNVWSEDEKRSVLRNSVAVHRRKGTLASVKNALRGAGYGDATVIEQFGDEIYDASGSYDGTSTYGAPDEWAEYRVRIPRPITDEQADQVRKLLATVAPARCHLRGLEYLRSDHTYNAAIRYDGQHTYGVS